MKVVREKFEFDRLFTGNITVEMTLARFSCHQGLKKFLIQLYKAEAMFVKHVAWMKGVESSFTRWMWWIQTTYFGLPSTKLMVNFDPTVKNE